MANQLTTVQKDMESIIDEWKQSGILHEGDLFIIGCSTSEIAGKKIGTSGSMDIAASLFESFQKLKKETGIRLAFQCCEHLNRAVLIERETKTAYHFEEVTAVPVIHAGGAMATEAYKQMEDPVLVETVNHQADAGMDIGETMIGMHLKHVAIPQRFNYRFIGEARVQAARTRPKKIGGERTNYEDIR